LAHSSPAFVCLPRNWELITLGVGKRNSFVGNITFIGRWRSGSSNSPLGNLAPDSDPETTVLITVAEKSVRVNFGC
jgi:hypothetical protein